MFLSLLVASQPVIAAPQTPQIEVIATTTQQYTQSTTTPHIYPLHPILERIAKCESGNIATAKNPNSSASGRFQFIRSSWQYYGKQLWGEKWVEKNVFDWEDNTELAVYVFNKNGTVDWNESKFCWSK